MTLVDDLRKLRLDGYKIEVELNMSQLFKPVVKVGDKASVVRCGEKDFKLLKKVAKNVKIVDDITGNLKLSSYKEALYLFKLLKSQGFNLAGVYYKSKHTFPLRVNCVKGDREFECRVGYVPSAYDFETLLDSILWR